MMPRKQVVWIGSSVEDLKSFPDLVKQTMGFALFQAQCGGKRLLAKVLQALRQQQKGG
jgi:phage-related protein